MSRIQLGDFYFLAVGNDELGDSLMKSEKAAFARQLLMSIAEILARECQKEERTKQGLLLSFVNANDYFSFLVLSSTYLNIKA